MGNINALMALGKIYEQGIGVKVDLYNAFVHYHEAAKKMEPQALYKLGELIEKGVGDEDNERNRTKQILGFYKNAIEKGSTKARVRMAQIYESGEHGMKVDKGKALELYESCIEEEPEAMASVGLECYNREDYVQAVRLFNKAAELGNTTALNNLGT